MSDHPLPIQSGDCIYHWRDKAPEVDGIYIQTNWNEFLQVRWVGGKPLNNQDQAEQFWKYPYFCRLFP